MNNEIRQAYSLPTELENKIFDFQEQSWELLEAHKIDEALAKITEAWNLLPEPKFNTSCSHIILCDLVPFLNVAGKHAEAKAQLDSWLLDLKNCGYKIYHTEPFILLGETLLYLKETQHAKEAFEEAVYYGATKRDFSEKPSFYFDVAKKKIEDDAEIERLFAFEINNDAREVAISNIELSDAILNQIESWSEEGNEYFDDEEYEKAIDVWKEALATIPKPQNIYSESLWLETSIGDAYFMLGDHENAFLYFLNAKSNIEENAYENAFIMLRVGQLYFEDNDLENAQEYLLRAYMLDGIEIFEGSKEKYFDFLQQNAKLD